jgi:hypothetical protein
MTITQIITQKDLDFDVSLKEYEKRATPRGEMEFYENYINKFMEHTNN